MDTEFVNFLKHIARNARFPIVHIGDTLEISSSLTQGAAEGRSIPIISVWEHSPRKAHDLHFFIQRYGRAEVHSTLTCSTNIAPKLITSPLSAVVIANDPTKEAISRDFLGWAPKIHPQGYVVIANAGLKSPWEPPKKFIEELLYNPDAIPLKWGTITVGETFAALKRIR